MTILSELGQNFNSLPRAVVFHQPDVNFEKKSEDDKKSMKTFRGGKGLINAEDTPPGDVPLLILLFERFLKLYAG